MVRFMDRLRRNASATPDDGTDGGQRLQPFRRREMLHRALFTISHDGPDGPRRTWTVDVRMKDLGWVAGLYLDGARQEEHDVPAAFAVPGGTIEVKASMYGITRMHLVLDSGRERRLAPVAGTAEDLRGRLARRHPRLSRTIGVLAIAILVVNLALAVPQAIEIVTGLPPIADHVGSFTSPVSTPPWLTAVLVFAGIVAATERVLMRRHNRLLDIETIWSSF
ncbi:hypothetical protein [Actinomadura algeriensis]|uniref:Uncharacterized protein n=1 Tax=Actinomadura algeriensis TaxID=1679523 RepID=A0ABR9JRH2_9ACTN|nr:hypothetical protein [Actinomadura algeriensis]MBE1533168.1 hypothetical protein [Actinomadura algeriensis]